jgi:hypothetical protein
MILPEQVEKPVDMTSILDDESTTKRGIHRFATEKELTVAAEVWMWWTDALHSDDS